MTRLISANSLGFVFRTIILHFQVLFNETPFTVELHLSGLNGTASYPNMQKIQIIGFFFENRLHWQFQVRLYVPASKPFNYG